MILEGSILNGRVELDSPAELPDGTRVRLVADDLAPPGSETREEFLQSLRESIAESKAGVRGVEARQFMQEMAMKHGLRLASEG